MSKGLNYVVTLALDLYRDGTWLKTPGQDEIKTKIPPIKGDEEIEMRAAAIVYLGMAVAGPESAYVDNGEKESIEIVGDELIVRGKQHIAYLVNELGVDFNGAAEYRAPTKLP